MLDTLNPKHETFAQELAKGFCKAEAYSRAGYKGERTAASRLSTNVNIRRRVKQLPTGGKFNGGYYCQPNGPTDWHFVLDFHYQAEISAWIHLRGPMDWFHWYKELKKLQQEQEFC